MTILNVRGNVNGKGIFNWGGQDLIPVKEVRKNSFIDIYGNEWVSEGAVIEGANGIRRDFILGRKVALDLANGVSVPRKYEEKDRLIQASQYLLEESGARWRLKSNGIPS